MKPGKQNKNPKYLIRTIVLFSGLMCCATNFAQDLSGIGSAKPFSISGSLSTNQVLYFLHGDETNERDPYSYFLSGNLNLSLYGWTVPLSVTYTNQEGSFQQPFNQYGLTPTYKWIKAYIGYNTMNFSKYSLSGYRFLGGGVELTPGPLNVTAFYGRMQKAVNYDSTAQSSIMAFERMGYGLKTGYTNNGHNIELMYFHADDDSSSLSFMPENSTTTPSANTVFGINGGTTLFQKISIRAEYANSAFTSDIRSEARDENFSGFAPASYFLPSQSTTSYYHAFNGTVNYMGTGYSIGAAYERVDPEYHTLGAYYSTNDLENISLNTSVQLLENKLSVQANGGLQRNDLANEKASAMNNLVGSVSASFSASEKLSINGAYSNYRTYTNIKSQFDYINQTTPWQNTDTLDFTQLTQNANLGMNLKMGDSEKRQQSLNVNISYQDASEKQGFYDAHNASSFYNGNAGYSIAFPEKKLNLAVTSSLSYVKTEISNSVTLGPVITASKSLFDGKMNNTLSFAYNQAHADGKLQNSVINTRYNAGITIKEKHSFNLGGVFLWRESKAYENQQLTETTITFSYSYSFSK